MLTHMQSNQSWIVEGTVDWGAVPVVRSEENHQRESVAKHAKQSTQYEKKGDQKELVLHCTRGTAP